MISITSTISIPDDELIFTFTRSGGPGGQNVNKVSTRVTLCFDVRQSPSLPDYARQRILARLANRINKEGVLRVVAQTTRSQAANREEALRRFVELLQAALHRDPPRRPTGVPAAERERRLAAKKRHGLTKRGRSSSPDRDGE